MHNTVPTTPAPVLDPQAREIVSETSNPQVISTVAISRPVQMPPFIRLRDAPTYLGMDKNRFNRDVRPRIPMIRIGVQGVAFDRLDLDAWADDYKSRNGCHDARSNRRESWATRKCQVSLSAGGFGTSTKCSEERAFAKALEQARSKKLRSC